MKYINKLEKEINLKNRDKSSISNTNEANYKKLSDLENKLNEI